MKKVFNTGVLKILKLIIYIPMLVVWLKYDGNENSFFAFLLIATAIAFILGGHDYEINIRRIIPIGIFSLLYSFMVMCREKINMIDNLNACLEAWSDYYLYLQRESESYVTKRI